MPIRFDKKTLDAVPGILLKVREIMEKGANERTDVYVGDIPVLSNFADGAWGHRGFVDVSILVKDRYRGKRSGNRAGEYWSRYRQVILFVEAIKENSNPVHFLTEVLLHELAHAQDLDHDYVTYLRAKGPQGVDVHYTDDEGKLQIRPLWKVIDQEINYVFSMIRPEAFPKRLDTPDRRAMYLAKAILKTHVMREIVRMNRGLSEDVLLRLLYGRIYTEKNVDLLEKLLDENKSYLRQVTEMRAYTQSVLEEMRTALKADRCGRPSLLKQAGIWGTKCAALTLELASPTYKRLKEYLTKDQLKRVMQDVARILQDEFFTGSPVAQSDRQVKKAVEQLAKRFKSEVRGALDEAFWASPRSEHHWRIIERIKSSPTFERAKDAVSEDLLADAVRTATRELIEERIRSSLDRAAAAGRG